MLLLLII